MNKHCERCNAFCESDSLSWWENPPRWGTSVRQYEPDDVLGSTGVNVCAECDELLLELLAETFMEDEEDD